MNTPVQFSSPGSIVWFSIKDDEYNPSEIIVAANAAKVPNNLHQKVRSRGDRNAWMVSTQFGDGIPGKTMPNETKAYYITEDMPGLSTTRVVLRMVKNSEDIEVETKQVAVVVLDGKGTVNVGIYKDFYVGPAGVTPEVYEEALALLKQIKEDMDDLVSTMSAAGVRSLIRTWLLANKCVPMKNGAGVYFLPVPVNAVERKEQEEILESLTDWVCGSPFNGEFMILPVNQSTPTKSQTQIVQSASSHLLERVREMNAKVREYEDKGVAGKQIRPSMIETIKNEIKGLREQAELLGEQLGIQIESVLLGSENLSSRLDTVLYTHGPEARKEAAKDKKKRSGTHRGRNDGEVL